MRQEKVFFTPFSWKRVITSLGTRSYHFYGAFFNLGIISCNLIEYEEAVMLVALLVSICRQDLQEAGPVCSQGPLTQGNKD